MKPISPRKLQEHTKENTKEQSLAPGSPRALLQQVQINLDSPRMVNQRRAETVPVPNSSAPASPRVTFGSVVHYQDSSKEQDPGRGLAASPRPGPASPRRSSKAGTQPAPQQHYPYPELSRFSGTKDQFKALSEDYKSLIAFFNTDNLPKQKKQLAKQLRKSEGCTQAQHLCRTIGKKIQETSRSFRKNDFPKARLLAQEAKKFDIELNTILINRKSEGPTFDMQNFWDSARVALEPCTAALSKLILLCADAVEKKEFKPGTPRLGAPDTPDVQSPRRLSAARAPLAKVSDTEDRGKTNTSETSVTALQTPLSPVREHHARGGPAVPQALQASEPQLRQYIGPPPPSSPPPPLPALPVLTPVALPALIAQPFNVAHPVVMTQPVNVAQPVVITPPVHVAQPVVITPPVHVAQPVVIAPPVDVAQPAVITQTVGIVQPVVITPPAGAIQVAQQPRPLKRRLFETHNERQPEGHEMNRNPGGEEKRRAAPDRPVPALPPAASRLSTSESLGAISSPGPGGDGQAQANVLPYTRSNSGPPLPPPRGGMKRAASSQLTPEHAKSSHTATNHSPGAVRRAALLDEVNRPPVKREVLQADGVPMNAAVEHQTRDAETRTLPASPASTEPKQWPDLLAVAKAMMLRRGNTPAVPLAGQTTTVTSINVVALENQNSAGMVATNDMSARISVEQTGGVETMQIEQAAAGDVQVMAVPDVSTESAAKPVSKVSTEAATEVAIGTVTETVTESVPELATGPSQKQ